jgi:hypothetical protein
MEWRDPQVHVSWRRWVHEPYVWMGAQYRCGTIFGEHAPSVVKSFESFRVLFEIFLTKHHAMKAY